jgi:U3 small nucleolar RNA-associated protein 18
MNLSNSSRRPKVVKAYAMPRQRSKKLTASRQTENSSAPEREERSDTENDSTGLLEKDEEEEELARLVLGDGLGFKAQLGQQMDLAMDGGSEEEESMVEEDSEGEARLENIDDAEVRGIVISQ